MELGLSGNGLKTFHRSINCLARLGSELVLQASPSQLVLHTLNSSRSAYQSITLKPDFFDVYNLSASRVQCSVLLKAVCSIFRTSITSIDRACVLLPNSDAAKLQWTLYCHNGMKKAYWIHCNVDPDIQHLSLDRRKFPSSFIVRPRDLNRLLANFQSSLQEITIIATEPMPVPSASGAMIGGKAVELRSYIDPTKDNSDAALHTQLWIDPSEEFLQYSHTGDAVDVTFSVKELKAFINFCEGCEVDIHLFFEKAGEPIFMSPKFSLDDGMNSDFDATMVLATMLISQLHQGNASGQPPVAPESAAQGDCETDAQAPELHRASAPERSRPANPSPSSGHGSDHTRIWSELSGSAAKGSDGTEGRQTQVGGNPNAREENDIQRLNLMSISKNQPSTVNDPQMDPQISLITGGVQFNGNGLSQRHPSNWISAGDDDDEDDEELYVQSTP